MEGYITTTEAAARLGISSARVRQLVISGDLPVTKFGPVNMVKEGDLELIRNRPSVGRPPKATQATPKPRKRATSRKRADGEAPSADGRVTVKKGAKKGGKK